MSEEPEAEAVAAVSVDSSIDLDTIETDLRDIEATLARLADGTYFPHESSVSDGPTEGAD